MLKPHESDNLSSVSKPFDETEKLINKCVEGLNVSFCRNKTSTGVVVIGFPDEKSKNQAESRISENTELKTVFTSCTPKKMLPKVTITGINNILFDECDQDNIDEMKEMLIKDITERNQFLKDNVDEENALNVVVLKKMENSYTAVLKISPKLRSIIKGYGDRLYVSLNVCHVRDRYHYTQCFHCQRLGHISNDCPMKSSESTCLFCSGPHRSKGCQKRNDQRAYRCINCATSPVESIRKQALSHTAADEKCPIIMRECKRLKQNTMEYEQPKNY